MLTREIMGALALSILWLNTLLVLAVALKHLRGIRALGARIRAFKAAGGLVEGTVSRADGGRFAVRRIQQLGRALTTGGAKAILFTDGIQSFEVFGGAVETPQGEVVVDAADPVRSEVWLDRDRGQQAVGGDVEAFDEAYPEASKYKGFSRGLEIDVKVGDRVWILGERNDDAVRAPDEPHPLVVSTVSPLGWVASRTRLILGFVAASVIALAGATALALWPPYFGLVSTLGGALGLVFFLAVQPLGTAVRDAVKTPARRLLNGEWRRGAA